MRAATRGRCRGGAFAPAALPPPPPPPRLRCGWLSELRVDGHLASVAPHVALKSLLMNPLLPRCGAGGHFADLRRRRAREGFVV